MLANHPLGKIVLIALSLIPLVSSVTFPIVPPRPGSGAVLPLGQKERDGLRLGFPGPVPRRFVRQSGGGGEVYKIEGTYPVPVLVGEYSNSTASYSDADFQALLFDGPNPTGTMKEYYEENSYGVFTVDGTVYGWFKVPETNAYYEAGNNGFGSYPTNAGGFVYDLAEASDAEVDYSLYDNDGPDGLPNSGDDNGYVDAFFAVHTGNGGECGGPAIWSHRSSIAWMGGPSGGYVTDDPSASGGFIHVNDYIIMPEMDCSESELNAIGVFCHEFGHSLGLPDLYDGDGSSEGIGGWGLMGSGSWGGDQAHPELPVHMEAWSKERLGWVEPYELTLNTPLVSLPQVEDSPTVVKAWKDGNYSGLEYFLIENRQKVGFDASLIIPGILIWHIDNSRTHNRDENHKWVDLEEADGTNGLDDPGNRGDAGDPWPGAFGRRLFDWFSQPDSYSYYGFNTEVSVAQIGDPDSLMSARFTVRSAVIDSVGWQMSDPAGDGDGVWDVGEEVELEFLVTNDSDTPAESLWAFISSEDTMVTVITDSIFVGTLEGNSEIGNAANPFIIASAPDAPVHRTILDLVLRGKEYFFWQASWEVMMGHPSVFVVDDSEPDSDYLKYYAATLDSLSVAYLSRNVASHGSPADTLEPFELVIWFTGKGTENLLDSTDLVALREHLERGGRLLLSGQNVVEDLHARGEPFLGEILKTGWGGTNPLPFAYGIEGDPVTDSIGVIISAGPRGANNQTSRDILTPLEGASPMAVYDTTAAGEAAALRVNFPQYNSRLILLGFGFEAVNRPSSDSTHVTRVELMRKMLEWLMVPVGIGKDGEELANLPRILSLGQNYPNPFNPSTKIVFTTTDSRHTELTVYSLRGTRVKTLLDTELEAGRHEVVWDGRDERGARVPSGVYFYLLESGGRSITRKMLVLK